MFDLSISGGCIIDRRFSTCADPRFLKLLEVVRGADLSFIHLEGAICEGDAPEVYPAAEAGWTWRRMPAFFAEELRWAGYDFVSHASNHAMDYMYGGLYETWKVLNRAGIPFAGTGMSLAAARRPAYVDHAKARLALISTSTSTPDWARAADPIRDDGGRPGINQIRMVYAMEADALADAMRTFRAMGWWVTEAGDGFMVNPAGLHNTITRFTLRGAPGTRAVADPADVEANLAQVAEAKARADFVMFHLHNHEWDVDGGLAVPPDFVRDLAHAAIDAGADLFLAEGAHSLLRGIEIYKGKPVFYDPGDLFKDGNSKTRPLSEYYWMRGTSPETGREEITTFDSRIHAAKQKVPVPTHPTGGYNTGRVLAVIVPVCRYDGGELREIRIHPAKHMKGSAVVNGLPGLVEGREAEEVVAYLAELSAPFGTEIACDGGIGVIRR
jgi:poly-gamma-glutamate capsule biosynthesis protein CapA/YwtB (metallophosphatase superfamily)